MVRANPNPDGDEPAAGQGSGVNGAPLTSMRKQKIHVEGLPDDMLASIKLKPWLGTQNFHSTLYRRISLDDVPGKSGKYENEFVCKKYNEEIDAAWCQAQKLYGKFLRILKWDAPEGEIDIDSTLLQVGRPPGEETTPGAATSVTGASPAAAQAGAGEGSRRQVLSDMLLLSEIMKNMRGDAPAQGAPATGAGIGVDALEKHLDRQLKRADDLVERWEKKVYSPPAPPKVEEKKGIDVDGLVKSYMPKISEWMDKLLGNDTISDFVRGQIIKDAKFKEVWADEGKRVLLAQSLTEHLGDAGGKLFNLFSEQVAKG